tara:strand:- start:45962 stop:47305 length:1344 start_codon:yes stop_codon:yes gene_type:complete
LKKIFLTFIILLISCSNEQDTYIGGKILKKNNNEIFIRKDENLIKKININEAGIFFSKLDSVDDGLYNFFHLPEFQYLILEKGDSLILRLNVLDFDESLVFTGKGSSKNNYLIDIFLKHEEEEIFIKSKSNLKEKEFKKITDSLLKNKTDEYVRFIKNNSTTKTTKLILKHAIKLPVYSSLETYISNLELNLNSSEIYDFRNDIDLNIGSLSNFKPYLDYIISRIFNESSQFQNKKNISKLDYNLNRIDFVKKNISQAIIRSKILRYIAYEYLLEESNLVNIDTFLNKFLETSKNEKTNAEINQLFSNIISLQSGNIIPEIELIDKNNSIIKTTGFDNKNPVIFVFWSYEQNSHQIGLFKRINRILDYNKNYDFHAININTDNGKWKNIINKYKNRTHLNHFRSVNFENMSKKMILNNLNKVIITNKKGEINKILTINELETYLNLN